MRPVLSCAVVALLAGAGPAPGQDTLPLDRARMYPLPARQVWQAALETVAALGMKADEMDAEHQLLITKFRAYGDATVAGPQHPRIPAAPVPAARLRLPVRRAGTRAREQR